MPPTHATVRQTAFCFGAAEQNKGLQGAANTPPAAAIPRIGT